ncbi:MAG TPA: hypothetical protein VH395_01195 [Jatrophihabitantaceae bacterium]|jgi:phage tail protein X
MSASETLWSGLIAAATALIVFVLTEFAVSRRERGSRVYNRRRQALLQVQDAALELRNGLAEYGPLARHATGAVPDAEMSDAQRGVDHAFALLDVALTRIEDEAVRGAVLAWRDRARFHYVSAEEVTTAEELELWQTMNAMIGVALTAP